MKFFRSLLVVSIATMAFAVMGAELKNLVLDLGRILADEKNVPIYTNTMFTADATLTLKNIEALDPDKEYYVCGFAGNPWTYYSTNSVVTRLPPFDTETAKRFAGWSSEAIKGKVETRPWNPNASSLKDGYRFYLRYAGGSLFIYY